MSWAATKKPKPTDRRIQRNAVIMQHSLFVELYLALILSSEHHDHLCRARSQQPWHQGNALLFVSSMHVELTLLHTVVSGVLAIVFSLGLYALDNTIVANVFPAIIQDLGQSEQLTWLSVGFTAGGLCLLLPLGKIYDLFDPKYVYLTSALIFFAGSALCGTAPNMNTMIVGRVVADIGGNGLYMGSLHFCRSTRLPERD